MRRRGQAQSHTNLSGKKVAGTVEPPEANWVIGGGEEKERKRPNSCLPARGGEKEIDLEVGETSIANLLREKGSQKRSKAAFRNVLMNQRYVRKREIKVTG